MLTPLLHVICVFYFIFAREERIASRQFLERVLPHPVHYWHVYKHIYYFASTILDRVYFFSGRLSAFTIEDRRNNAESSLRKQSGQLWLGAHFGSLDALRAVSSNFPEFSFKVVMRIEQNSSIFAVLNELNPNLSNMIIPARGMETIFSIADAIIEGQTVCVLNDRVTSKSNNTITCFFGGKIPISIGAIQAALHLKAPIMQFFSIYLGNQHYTSRYIEIDTTNKTAEDIAQIYIQNLEEMCKKYPYNWFNFFDYWSYDEN